MATLKGRHPCKNCMATGQIDDWDYDDDIWEEISVKLAFDFRWSRVELHNTLHQIYKTWDGRPSFFLDMIAPLREVRKYGVPLEVYKAIRFRARGGGVASVTNINKYKKGGSL